MLIPSDRTIAKQEEQGNSDSKQPSDRSQFRNTPLLRQSARYKINDFIGQKVFRRRPPSIYYRLAMERPMTFNHMFNFFNLAGVSERALRYSDEEETHLRSTFYVKKIEKVEVRRKALVITVKPLQIDPTPVEYIVERYRSFGDAKAAHIASKMEDAYRGVISTPNFNSLLVNECPSEPLSRFIESMKDSIYVAKVQPNKVIISKSLLDLLGEDIEQYAIELIKYKTCLREVVSANSYMDIIEKTFETIISLCEMAKQTISFSEVQDRVYSEFLEQIITRSEQRIRCKLALSMPSPLIQCMTLVQVYSTTTSSAEPSFRYRSSLLRNECQDMRYKEAEVIRKLVGSVPHNFMEENKDKVAHYMPNSEMSSAET